METERQTTSSPVLASVTMSNSVPVFTFSSRSAWTETVSGSSAVSQRVCSIWLRTCTSPIAGNGNERAVMMRICRGKPIMCG